MARVEWTRIDRDDLEHLVAMLLCRQNPHAQRIRASKGDGGVDILVPLGEGKGFAIYQVKAFSSNLGSSQKSQIEHSYRRLEAFAAEHELTISEWYLALPLDGTHENHSWLAEVTGSTAKYEQWRGLAFLDGLVTAYPEVVDYYLANGRDRLQQAMQALAGAIGIGGFTAPADLSGSASIPGLAGIHETINKTDPHYRYDFAVNSAQIALPAAEDALVAAVQREYNESWVTFKIYARCLEALRERPIPFSLVVDLKDAPAETRLEFENFHKYGTAASAPTGSVTFFTDLPGGLGGSFTGGSAQLGPVYLSGGSTYQLRLRILEPSGAVVAETRVDMEAPTVGVQGVGYGAYGVESSGVFDLRILTDIGSPLLRIHLGARDFSGKHPSEVLPAVQFISAFAAPNVLQFAQPYGPPDTEPMRIPQGRGTIELDPLMLDYVAALADLQAKTPIQLRIPNLDLVTRREAAELVDASRLLRGEQLTIDWFQVPIDLTTADVSVEPMSLLLRQELVVMVEGTPIRLGVKQTHFPSVKLDAERSNIPGGKGIFVPHDTSTATVTLLEEATQPP